VSSHRFLPSLLSEQLHFVVKSFANSLSDFETYSDVETNSHELKKSRFSIKHDYERASDSSSTSQRVPSLLLLLFPSLTSQQSRESLHFMVSVIEEPNSSAPPASESHSPCRTPRTQSPETCTVRSTFPELDGSVGRQ